jgi:hypothetical protein
MRALDDRSVGVLAIGMLSSMVLLASSSCPPSVTVSDLWSLGADSPLTVSGILVSLHAYESGTEILVISDECGSPTVRVICSPGPGPPPSARGSLGDLLLISGRCVFVNGTPAMYCAYTDVEVLRESEEVLTVALLCAAWDLFLGDEISVGGVSEEDLAGRLWLRDADGGCRILMVLTGGTSPRVGNVVAECTLVLDTDTMSFVLEVSRLTADG